MGWEFDDTLKNRLYLDKASYTLEEVEQLKAELRYRVEHVHILRGIRVCYCLDLLGIEYHDDTGEFTEGDGVEWLIPKADITSGGFEFEQRMPFPEPWLTRKGD